MARIKYHNGTEWVYADISVAAKGEPGVTPNLTIGTVTTLPTGAQATAYLTGTTENPVLNLGLPAGAQGEAASGITQVYHVGTSAPSNTSLLWIDTTATTGGLKYYNGSSWAHVPVAYT